MNGTAVKFYLHELQKHDGMSLYQWLLEFARKNDVQGGSAFRAIAGFGRHGHMHEEHFFELGSNVPVEVTFIMANDKVEGFLELLRKENLHLFYVLSHVEMASL